MNQAPLLEAKNLAVGYDKPLLSGIHGSVKRGQLIALVGRNGRGKSTLLRTLLGMHPALGGQVFLGKEEISKLSEGDRARKCSAVLTDKITVGGLTIKQIVSMGRQPYLGLLGKLGLSDWGKIEAAMVAVGLEKLADKSIEEVSDGERQKCMIARAMAQDTPLIIMDEPLAFLDHPSKIEVLSLLKEMVVRGKSVLFSTHELHFLPTTVDELWLIDEVGTWECASGSEVEPALNRVFGDWRMERDSMEQVPQTGTKNDKGHGDGGE